MSCSLRNHGFTRRSKKKNYYFIVKIFYIKGTKCYHLCKISDSKDNIFAGMFNVTYMLNFIYALVTIS